jgi:hypothetical protein
MLAPKEMDFEQPYLKLLRALYGLKQASREWHLHVSKIIKQIGFTQLTSESCIFVKRSNGIIILALYVDDMIIGSDHNSNIEWLYDQLSKHFVVKQNKLTRCLGLDVNHNTRTQSITLSRNDYSENIISEYNELIRHLPMTHTCLPEGTVLSRSQCPSNTQDAEIMKNKPYRQIIGKLNYYTCTIRADICFAVNYLARFMDNPGIEHWNCLLHLLAYIRDYPYACITYKPPDNLWFLLDGERVSVKPDTLYCFVDADFATSDPD